MQLGGAKRLRHNTVNVKRFIHAYLFCGIVSKGTAVVREAPAEAAAQQRRQEETVFLQDQNLFFQTHYLTYGASWHLYKKVYSVIASGHHQQEVAEQSEKVFLFLNCHLKKICTHKELLLVKNR